MARISIKLRSCYYEKLAVYRPLVPVGRADVGFLPGGLDEKLDPWMSAIHDSIVALTDQRSSNDAKRLIEDLTARGQLSLESVTFLRGRSLHRQFVVVDEAQNLEPTTLKTILTRIGEGTKVVFTGDTSQIDAPYMGESNNALAVLIHAFANQHCFGHVTLAFQEPLITLPFAQSRILGALILVDTASHKTSGAVLVN